MPVQRTTVANDNTIGGAGTGVAIAIMAALVLVALLVWAVNGGLKFGPSGDVGGPAVTVTPDGQ